MSSSLLILAHTCKYALYPVQKHNKAQVRAERNPTVPSLIVLCSLWPLVLSSWEIWNLLGACPLGCCWGIILVAVTEVGGLATVHENFCAP